MCAVVFLKWRPFVCLGTSDIVCIRMIISVLLLVRKYILCYCIQAEFTTQQWHGYTSTVSHYCQVFKKIFIKLDCYCVRTKIISH